MSTKAVSFRFHQDADREERYSSFVDRLRKAGMIWEETTSFALVNTDMTADALQSDLYINSKFNSYKDLMIVIDIGDRDASTRGPVAMPYTLGILLPKVQIR